MDRVETRPSLGDLAARALDAGGIIARGLAASGVRHEAREGQLSMARAVGEAVERERVLLCEAGTGTGKTLAYLVPALLSGRRVVVSTATKALQEQIFTKDLPVLAAHLGVPVNAALMKGLANYVCLRRLDESLKASGLVSTDRAQMLAKIDRWARESETGDRVELAFLRDDDPAWRDVQSGSDTRIGPGCAFHDRCFVTKMREDAQRARLVVVNHHLYLADLALRKGGARQGVIPEHDVVVFDEAHQLEEIATEFFGVRASTARVESIVRDARRTFTALAPQLGPKVAEATTMLSGISDAAQGFFAALAMMRAVGQGESRAPLDTHAFTDDANDRYAKLDAVLEALARFANLEGRGSDAREEIGVVARRITALRDDLARIVAPGRDEIPWIEVRARGCAIGVAPLDLAPVFRAHLFGDDRNGPRSVVLTSATLATAQQGNQGPFVHAKRRLGLTYRALQDFDDDAPPEPEERPTCPTIEIVVPSPFDFRKNAGVYVPLDLPEPNDPLFLERAGARVLDLVRASKGGAFVLCASAKNMRALHARLLEADLPYPLLCQGERPKSALLDEFRAARHAVLVATMGFWEGVDVPGQALRLVVIDKLPFAVPTDPVVAARLRAIEETGRSSFAEISVPDAAIALKQGFGRLIRTRDDAGVVAILDKRIRTKGYGRVLRASLPPASPLHELDHVRQFFEVVVGVA